MVTKSWFAFDHFYSDSAFDEALKVVFRQKVKRLLDVGGNTGRWATRCVGHEADVEVTIVDLPQQLELMRKAVAGRKGRNAFTDMAATFWRRGRSFRKNLFSTRYG